MAAQEGMSEFAQPRMSESSLNEERMAVVINLDVSSSVSPEQLRMLEDNVAHFREVVMSNEQAARSVDVAVVTFGDTAKVLVDWCNIADLPRIHLVNEIMTDLSGGCLKAAEMLRDRGRFYGSLGIVAKKPYLITMTDGYHTAQGTIDPAADFIAQRESEGKLKHWFLGLTGYDRTAAAALTRASGCRVFEAQGAEFSFDFFDFAANSVKVASTSAPGEQMHVETPIATGESPVKAVALDDWLNK